jgi:hypothetical protein
MVTLAASMNWLTASAAAGALPVSCHCERKATAKLYRRCARAGLSPAVASTASRWTATASSSVAPF